MNTFLTVKSSINGQNSVSNQLIDWLATRLKHGEHTIIERDLGFLSLPHLSQEELTTWMTDENNLNDDQLSLRALSDSIIAEVKEASAIVLGLPMYNFGVPSNFKAWIDRLARAGVTFSYTENGPIGLLENKPIYVIATRGGIYQGTPKDSQTQYIKNVFSFLGLHDVHFVYVEGLAMGNAQQIVEQAKEQLHSLVL
ncbi:FMN-dependent NADH-azoreductase [Pseudoalteromonas luteoviolacea B = ATCC 29581]|nr:FMN-dependent NADH-azoreductase [Pseudoalteromonas luteoviolacea B = ATCC 29581]